MSHLKDLFVWINESEHFKLGVVQKDGNLKSVFQRLMLNVENIWNYFKWVQDEDNLGKFPICFTNFFHNFFSVEVVDKESKKKYWSKTFFSLCL